MPSRPQNENQVLDLPISEGIDLTRLISQVAIHYLKCSLAQQTGGNKTQAAKLLGFSNYQTFTNWLKKYGVGN